MPTRWIGRENLEHGDDGYYSHVQFNWENKNSFPDCVCVSESAIGPSSMAKEKIVPKFPGKCVGYTISRVLHFSRSHQRVASFSFLFLLLNFRVVYIYFTYSFFPLFQNISRQCKKCWNNQDVDALASLGCPAFPWRWLLSRTF